MDGIGTLRAALPGASSAIAQQTPNSRAAPEVVGKAFEEMFASILIKQMRQTLDGDSMFAGDSSDVLGGLFDHYIGQHIAKSGGFGVGAMIRTQLERQAERTRST